MKTNTDLLRDFIKSNKERRQQLAKKAGFGTPEQYKEYLVALITGGGTISSATEPSVKPTIHLLDLLDSSGSMEGGKYINATRGIKEGLAEFRNETEVNYTYSLVEFVDDRKIIDHQYKGSLNLNPAFFGANGANTPLYKALYDALVKLDSIVPKEDKVLVKVYTDGGNNTLHNYASLCRNKIEELRDNFTVTIAGPSREIADAVRTLGLDDTNTLVIEDNARGFQMAFMESIGATRSYAKKVSLKQDVKAEFYSKKVGKL